jgi:phosphatidylserine/phosphatidylglycerophosphate/cardiolipin synthase-like enzyme
MAAIQIRQNRTDEADAVSLVWTGPVQFDVPMRSTMAVTREMILGSVNRIIIVGYRITLGAKSIFDALAAQQSRGIVVTVILDEATNQKGILSKMWPKSMRLPTVYENRNEGSLHAKLTLVDGRDMLVTSANLTYRGFQSNIEIGVRIKGPSTSKVDELLNALIRDGHFRELEL